MNATWRMAWWLVLVTPAVAPAEPLVRFNRDVRPILSDACFRCHGPDASSRQADLRLDTREGLFASRDTGAIVKPGEPEASLLLLRVRHVDAAERMPPPDSGKTLTASQVRVLTEWIRQGAPWEDHWAFVPPTRPNVPAVSDDRWPRTAIDRFVLSALEGRGWTPAGDAAPETLLRRVTLDLTGLPPTLEEIDAFLADSSPDRYERLVERLLASPRFGEHLAVDWLDAARYADTSGYQNDGPREMWRWRDWVIAACNANLPFDRFTREQLAGDLLVAEAAAEVVAQPRGFLPRDPRSLNLLLATGFQRNHRGNSEGGIIPEEYAVEYVADRVDTFGAVWLGLTVGCARCHSHKYDPISQTDYYRLFAYFNRAPEYGRAIKEGNSPPYITAPTPDQWRRLQELEGELQIARTEWERLQPELLAAQRDWEASGASGPKDLTLADGLEVWLPLKGDLALPLQNTNAVWKRSDARGDASPRSPLAGEVKTSEPPFVAGPPGQGLQLDGTGYVAAGDAAKFSYFDAFSVAAWIRPDEPLSGGIVSRTSDDAYADGWTFQLQRGRLQVNLVKRWLDDAIRVETSTSVAAGKWQHVAFTYDGSRTAAGIAVYLNGERQPLNVHYDFLNQNFTNDEPLRIGSTGTQHRLHGALADVRIYRTALSALDVAVLATADSATEIAAIAPQQRTAGQSHKLQQYFLQHGAPGHLAAAAQRRRAAEQSHRDFLKSLPTAMVMVDRPTPQPTFVLKRGVYDQPGESVSPGIPAAFTAFVPQPSALNPQPCPDRLALADWLLAERHPLTARVTVNRFWQRLFGTGLVKTSEDFGTQGEPPSHPELLDWLAVEFVRNGWDVKQMHRLIVNSAVYRQSSRGTTEQLQADPENRWLSRGPRFRLSAEAVRDQALHASGLLEERLGGPSIRPYQPPGLWQEIATDTQYEPSAAPDVHRRSLYCYVKRTVANPTLTLFDAPTREACTLRRSRTSTPLQALTLWNDPTFVEAARVLATRCLITAADDSTAVIGQMFRRVTGRAPRPEELKRLSASWSAYRLKFREQPETAAELLNVGTARPESPPCDAADLAAYATVASVLLNLDEAVTKE